MSDTVGVEEIFASKRAEADWVMSQHAFFKYRKRLYEYDATHDLAVPESAYYITRGYLDTVDQCAMEKPILHLYGDQATGKTVLAIGLAAFIVYNYTRFDRHGLYAGHRSVEYIDWPIQVQRILSPDYDASTNYQADLLILDGLDAIPTLPKSGDPWQITHLYARLKPRLDAGLVTILITYRNYRGLQDYLPTKANGSKGDAIALEQATRLVGLFALRSFGSGRTCTPSASKAALRGQAPSYKNVNFQYLWPATTWAGTPVCF